MTISTDTRFYAACLESYNNGRLHGAWIDATGDAEEMGKAVEAMLKASPYPHAEEWAIHDYDDEHGLISHFGEYGGVDHIAEVMAAMEGLEDDYNDAILPLLINWVSDKVSEPSEWASILQDSFLGTYTDAEDYAIESSEGSMGDIPDHIKNYIDFKEMARDWALNGMDFICLSTGSSIQDYDSMRGRECIALNNH